MDIDWGMIASGMPTPEAGGFQQRFNPALPPTPPPMIDPATIAKQFAARGVPPPMQDAPPLEPIRMPDNNVGSSTWRQDFDMNQGGGDLGSVLTGGGGGGSARAPMDIRPPAQQAGSTDISAQARPQSGMDKFAETLKGVRAPAGPVTQRLGTPAAPRPTTQIKGGEILALLQMLNGSAGGSEYKLPSTLGAAIRK